MSAVSITNLKIVFLVEAGTIVSLGQNHVTHAKIATPTVKAADIVRDPSDLPSPIGDRAPVGIRVTLTSKELVGVLDPTSGTTYRYWTFNGKVPGPFIRVRQGDTIEISLANPKDSLMVHSIDFHAVIGPGGGAALLQVPPGQSKTFTFGDTTPKAVRLPLRQPDDRATHRERNVWIDSCRAGQRACPASITNTT